MPDPFHFATEVRVRLPETDAFGIVFHGCFFTYFDVARMDYVRNLGMQDFLRPISGFTAPIAHASADFRSPARFDDVLVVHARVAEIGRTSFTMEFRVVHKARNAVVAEGRTVQVVVDETSWKAIAVPDSFRSKVRAFEGAGLVERS
jgi:acyl-CoA thioester hydrolase